MSVECIEEIDIAKLKRLNPKQPLKKSLMINNAIKETFMKSTCHGFPNILNTKNLFLRVSWVLIIITFMGLCAYLIIEDFFKFFSFNVNTHTRKFFEMPTKFPIITICNKNMFNSKAAFDFATKTLSEYNLTLENFFYDDRPFDLKSTSMTKNYSDSFRKSLGKSLNEFVLSCRYDDENCSFDDDFTWTYDKNYGNCWKFGNASKPKDAYFTSKFYGLVLNLNVQINKELSRYTNNLGAVIILENNSNEIDIPVGFETNIVVDRVYSNHLKEPYGICQFNHKWPKTFNRNLYELFLANNLVYNQKDCIDICHQELALNRCNCMDRQSFKISNLHDYCFKNESIRCLNEAYGIYKQRQNSYVINFCMPSCPLECQSIDFQVTPSFSQLAMNTTSIAKVNIFYESLSYLEISETEAMNAIDLISGIGGIMGLFMGVSFMSAFEFLEMLFKIILILFKKV